MTAQRVAGATALVSGLLLVLATAASLVAGPAAFGNDPRVAYRQVGPGMMGSSRMGPGMMGMGPGMMGFANTGPAATAVPGAAEVRVQAANFSLAPNEIRLPKNADVNLTLANPTGVLHDLTVPALGIHIVANAGETRTVGLRGLAPGRYDGYCSVPGHADLGMRATVVVE